MQTLVDRYLALWNEPDADRRSTLSPQVFAEGATYRDPLMEGAGREGIEALVVAVQSRFPDHLFRSEGPVDTVGDHARFSWTLGPADGPPTASGTDFVRVEDGRFASVVGFFDAVGAA